MVSISNNPFSNLMIFYFKIQKSNNLFVPVTDTCDSVSPWCRSAVVTTYTIPVPPSPTLLLPVTPSSHWSADLTHWPLIGWQRSRDLNTGLSLAEPLLGPCQALRLQGWVLLWPSPEPLCESGDRRAFRKYEKNKNELISLIQRYIIERNCW